MLQDLYDDEEYHPTTKMDLEPNEQEDSACDMFEEEEDIKPAISSAPTSGVGLPRHLRPPSINTHTVQLDACSLVRCVIFHFASYLSSIARSKEHLTLLSGQ
jgi:hypothetical protein